MNFVITSLLICLAKSICYDNEATTINGSNIIPEGMPIGWLTLEPFNLTYNLDDGYDCTIIEYRITNITLSAKRQVMPGASIPSITNKAYNYANTIYFQLYDINNENATRLFCEKSCNFTIDCEKLNQNRPIASYFVDNPDEHFDYDIMIIRDKFDTSCVRDVFIWVLVILLFMAGFLTMLYQTIRNKNSVRYQSIDNFQIQISE